MKNPGIRYLALLVLVAAANLSGCVSIQSKSTAEIKMAEVKMVEAADALDEVNRQSSDFYSRLGSLMEEIKRFCARSGWLEFEQILLEYPSLKDPDSQVELTPEIEKRFSEWSRRWNSSWEKTMLEYRTLVDKCIIAEAKRLAARERLIAIQAKYLQAAMLEISAGREVQGKEIYALVELLDKTGAELQSYQTDDLGLYRLK